MFLKVQNIGSHVSLPTLSVSHLDYIYHTATHKNQFKLHAHYSSSLILNLLYIYEATNKTLTWLPSTKKNTKDKETTCITFDTHLPVIN